MTAPALAAVGLSAGFGPRAYVRDLDLDVRPGEIVTILGANGAGKTTTIMALAGQLKARGGEVRMAGRAAPAATADRVRAGMAVVTQDRCVFMNLSVLDNLRLGRGRIDDAVDLFPELRPHLHRRVGLLSGGQQQMLAVARVLAARPRVILADEISLGLAPKIVERLLSAIEESSRAAGTAVVLVEQQVVQALRYADRAYVLRRGALALTAPTSELAGRFDEIRELYL